MILSVGSRVSYHTSTAPFFLSYNFILSFGQLNYNQQNYFKYLLKYQIFLIHLHLFISKYKPALFPVTCEYKLSSLSDKNSAVSHQLC